MNLHANQATAALYARLAARDWPRVSDATLDEIAAGQPRLMLMLSADPLKYPEVADNVVIVPEVLAALGAAAPAVAWADVDESAKIARRFGVLKFPALLMLAAGDYVGVIAGLRNWPDIVEETAALLTAPTRRAPSIGIPLTAANTKGCA
ncbi:hydrogenase [Crenobacter caeni]|uniref:Hydrogenase expression/formation protein n=1 Tax=Crenobacter caeni TaxID=2705474 RepID=A0A6B2KV48_9NEIS|nr:hydrogenase [Crenobacter caeni]NDV13984.1 hydrogenase [Crenobacter caeni]